MFEAVKNQTKGLRVIHCFLQLIDHFSLNNLIIRFFFRKVKFCVAIETSAVQIFSRIFLLS